MSENRRLEGKVAVVVGAGSSGPGWSNGSAVAATYARHGAKVLAVDIDLARAKETASAISGEGHVCIAFRGDARSAGDMEAAMAEAVSRFSGLDIVHNNVGVASTGESGDILDVDYWNAEIATTLTTAFMGSRAAIPHLRARGGGVILNVSSIASIRTMAGGAFAYAAAKAGVESLTLNFAAAYGPENIRVNALRIGFCETPLVRRLYAKGSGLSGDALEAVLAAPGKRVPLRNERTQVWDVANAALFLASDEARHISGVILNVDGGLEAAAL